MGLHPGNSVNYVATGTRNGDYERSAGLLVKITEWCNTVVPIRPKDCPPPN